MKDSCCFGVGYSPEVSNFSITDGQEEVETLHVGQSLVMECRVYGYPGTDTRAEIVGPSGFSDNGALFHGLYRARYVVKIPRVTEGYSGTYTCHGWLTLAQGGETHQERSSDIIQKNLVVYEPPKITRIFQDVSATDETVTFTFVCEVTCSIEYNVTWLHNGIMLNITEDGKYHMFNHTANQHKLMVTLTSPSDVGIYTCVVNTKFRLKEMNTSFGFDSFSFDLHSPVTFEQPYLPTSLTFTVVLVVVLIIIMAVVIRKFRKTSVVMWLLEKLAGIVKMVFKTNRESEEIPLRQLETGELGSCANVGLDGRSHYRKEEERPRMFWNKLTSDDLGLVLEEVLDVSSQWYNLGLQLRVRTGTLECIRTKDHDHTDQLRDMLRAWLNTGDDPQWKTLTNALRSQSVGASQLAGDLERKYCLVEGTTREGKITLERKHFLPHCSGPTSPTEQPTTVTIASHSSTPAHKGPTMSYTVDDQVHYFEKRFDNLINEVCQQVNEKMKPSNFLFCVSNLPVSARNQHRSFIEEKLMNIPLPVNFVKIWSTMNLYWDFLNYGFLEHVINKFGSENLKQQMQEYISELHTFKQRTRLFDFIKSWSCKDYRQREDCLKKVVIKMQKEWSQCTLQDLESFSESLVHKFFLPGSDMLFHDAQEGCVCATWLTSPSIAELLHQNLATVETEFFKKHSIELVTIAGQDIYPTLEKRCSGYLRESYTSEQYAVGPPTPAEKPFLSTRAKEEKQTTDELTRQCLQKDLE